MQLIKHMQSAPSETDLLKDAIAVLKSASTPAEELVMALEAMQVLVEPIDNANGTSDLSCCCSLALQHVLLHSRE